MSPDVRFEGQHLTCFRPVINDEVRVVIMKPPCCERDPLPTNLLKKVRESLPRLIAANENHWLNLVFH